MTKSVTVRTAPDLRPVEECAEVVRDMTPKQLVTLWKRQHGAPKLVKIKPGVYRVDWTEFLDWLEDRTLPTAEQKKQRRAVIRRAAFAPAARPRPVRSDHSPRGNAESC